VALPIVIAKNQTAVPIGLTRLGVTVPAFGTVNLTDFAYIHEIGSDETLNTAVVSGNIVINDGTSDLSPAEGDGYLDTTGNLNGPVTGMAQGKLVRLKDTTGRYTEAVDVKVYDPSAVDPVAPVPADGDIYFNTVLEVLMAWDAARGKWLAVGEGASFQVGHQGTIPVGTYFRGIDGKTLGATLGYVAPWNGTVVGMSFSRTNVDATTFQVTADGATIESVATGANISGLDNSLDGDFNQGDILAVRNASGGDKTMDTQVWVRMKWRV
jgi:hypothetical protein